MKKQELRKYKWLLPATSFCVATVVAAPYALSIIEEAKEEASIQAQQIENYLQKVSNEHVKRIRHEDTIDTTGMSDQEYASFMADNIKEWDGSVWCVTADFGGTQLNVTIDKERYSFTTYGVCSPDKTKYGMKMTKAWDTSLQNNLTVFTAIHEEIKTATIPKISYTQEVKASYNGTDAEYVNNNMVPNFVNRRLVKQLSGGTLIIK